jgi:hypothetical protein
MSQIENLDKSYKGSVLDENTKQLFVNAALSDFNTSYKKGIYSASSSTEHRWRSCDKRLTCETIIKILKKHTITIPKIIMDYYSNDVGYLSE